MNIIRAILGGAVMGAYYAVNVNLRRKVDKYNDRIYLNQKKLDKAETNLKQLVAHIDDIKETE